MTGRIAFLGAGAMGEALLRGLLQARVVEPAQVLAADVDGARRTYLAERYGVQVTEDNKEAVANCLTVILAVKPQVAATVLREVGGQFRPGQRLLSVVAGWPLGRLRRFLPSGVATVRAMPNTPCLVGRGITGLSYGEEVTPADRETAKTVFAAVGEVVELPEPLLDAVTALSGSGPAYVFLVIEALTDAGVRMGLPRSTALKLVVHTLAGSVALLQETGTHPAALREMVTSPAGTTAEALAVMEEAGLRGIFGRAVMAARRRAQELAREES